MAEQGYKKEEQFAMSEMEWGVNSYTNTTYMNFEFDIDSLYSTIVKLDYLQRVNPHLDATFTNNIFLPLNAFRSSSLPSKNVKSKSYKFTFTCLLWALVHKTIASNTPREIIFFIFIIFFRTIGKKNSSSQTVTRNFQFINLEQM